MKRLFSTLAALGMSAALAACAGVPRPQTLLDLDRVREGAAAAEAKTYAPDAYAKAEKIRGEAEAAFDAHDTAGAQLLAERAVAAFAHAHALARTARAVSGARDADVELQKAESEVGGLDADQARVGADADALELKVRVARDAQPIQPSGRVGAPREEARFTAARSLAFEAKLLCGAAKLLGAAPGANAAEAKLSEAEAVVTKVESELGSSSVAPIDGASRARAGCLAALTALRRAASPVSKAAGAGDALLAELSAVGGLNPSRDDRGVVVTLRGVFAGNGVAAGSEGKLVDLGKVAAAHPSFPALVVVHSDKPGAPTDEAAERSRGEAVVAALQKGSRGSLRATAVAAGGQAPLVDPKGRDKSRNARVEIVFVTPESF